MMFGRWSLILLFTAGALSAAPEMKTVWDGVYTGSQATRGEVAYMAQCARCHRDDLSGYGNVLIGPKFMEKWREDNAFNFFHLVKTTMPRQAPASLTDQAYVDIVAYVLRVNGFPEGKEELKVADLESVRIQNREGPQAVPDFALVQTTGCLTQRADGEWIVTSATEPIRTRKPDAATAEDLKQRAALVPGKQSYRLMDLKYVNPDPPKNQRVEAKGFLIRQAGDDRLNTTSVAAVGAACER